MPSRTPTYDREIVVIRERVSDLGGTVIEGITDHDAKCGVGAIAENARTADIRYKCEEHGEFLKSEVEGHRCPECNKFSEKMGYVCTGPCKGEADWHIIVKYDDELYVIADWDRATWNWTYRDNELLNMALDESGEDLDEESDKEHQHQPETARP